MRFLPIFTSVVALFSVSLLHSATIDIAPVGRLVEIQSPGESFNWSVKVSDLQQGQTVTWQINGWNNEDLTRDTPLSLNNGEGKIQYKPTKVGWQEIIVTVRDAKGNPVIEKKRGFVSGETRKQKPDDFKYGVAAHLLRSFNKPNNLLAADIEVVDRLGVAYIRDDMTWEHLQPKPDVWNWEPFDTIIGELEKRGVQYDAILSYTAKWASTDQSDEKKSRRVTPKMDPWLTYVKQFVGRYKGRIKYWEIWNEPDIGFWQSSTEEFVGLFGITAKTIREVYPEAKIMNGGFAVVKRDPNMNFIDEFIPKADKTNWDIFAYHDYPSFNNLFVRRQYISSLYDKFKLNMPVWMNEGGLSAVGVGERTQAIVLAKKLATAPSLNMEAYIVYDLKNDGTNPNDNEHNFGLVWNDLAAKPGFATYQTLLRLLGGRKFIKTIKYDENSVWAQIYGERSDDKSQIAFLWSEGNLGTSLIWIDQLQNAELYDIMGNPIPSKGSDSGALLPIGDVPIYVKGGAPKDGWTIKNVLTPPPVIVLAAGGKKTTSLTFANPLSRSIRVSAETVEISDGIRPLKLAPTEVKPNSSTELPLTFECSSKLDDKPSLKLRLAVDNSSLDIKLPVVVAQALPLVSKSDSQIELAEKEGKIIELNTAESIFNLYFAEPVEEMHWHGAGDLSATAHLAYSKEALYITVRTTDDIHVQKLQGEAFWKGDSIQIAVQADPQQKNFFQFGLSLYEGKKQGWINQCTDKSYLSPGSLRGNILPYSVHRDGNITTYAVKIPWNAVGLNAPPESALRLNFIVNDDDGKGRKQWVRLSDGMGGSLNPGFFRWFSCEK